ncbi:MAG: HD domain-containing protein [Lachnospiraceae bacterium]|nr:HD domain-containing protein [Lachnospiraceae bacterium]MDE6761982.1 HD domain-containing protein [Lachnospiraceae bacterium]
MTALLIAEMIRYYSGDPKRIQHFIKVHDFSRTIGMLEGLDEKTFFILETAAIVHDIGIKKCEKKYGSCEGKLQEKEGPGVAEKLLGRLGYQTEVIERVCYLVGHHHTYTDIEGIDYQILVEADFLVNLYEDNLPKATIRSICERIFKTASGRKLCREMFRI